MQAQVTEPYRDNSDAILSYIPVPFALSFTTVAPRVIRCEESNAAQLRAMWALVLLVLGIALAVLIFSLTRTTSGPTDPRVIIVLVIAPPVLAAWGIALFRRHRVPLRQLEYDCGRGVFRARIYRGAGRHLGWSEYCPGYWSVRVQEAAISRWGWKRHVAWKGHAAAVYLGSERFLLICSKRREKVLAYVRSLPIDQRSVVEDATVLRGQAWLNGDLLD